MTEPSAATGEPTGRYLALLSPSVVQADNRGDPCVPAEPAGVSVPGLEARQGRTTRFPGRETLIPGKHTGIASRREPLFAVMSRDARTATSFFGRPPNRVAELGAQIQP